MAEINTEKYKPNSYRAKVENEKNAVVPIKGKAQKREQTYSEKLKGKFMSWIDDVVIPSLLSAVVDTGKAGLDMLFKDEIGKIASVGRRADGGRYVPYSRPTTIASSDFRRNARTDFSDFEFENEEDALYILDMLDGIIRERDFATVLDMYQYIPGVKPNPVDDDYGWTSLRTAEVRPTRKGTYILVMPRPKALR